MNTYKLLIADDEPLIRRGISSLDWEKIGITVCAVANNGKEAIDLASLHIPDLVLADIRMPIVNGLDMAERVLAQNKKCKIIFLSGYEDFAYAKRALHMGAFDYILKPASPEEILETCRRATLQIRQETEACQLPSVHMAVLEREAREMRAARRWRSRLRRPAKCGRKSRTARGRSMCGRSTVLLSSIIWKIYP